MGGVECSGVTSYRRAAQKRPTAKEGGTRHDVISSDGILVNIRDGKSAGDKTDNDTYTLEVKWHKDIASSINRGNMEIKFR